MKPRLRFALLSIGLSFTGSLANGIASAETSNSPYIDQLRKSLPAVQDSEGYTESIKKHLRQDTSEGYTERLKESPALRSGASSSAGYTDRVRQTLEPKTEGGAIEAVKEGHSELKMIKSLDIQSAVGIRVGLGLSRNITAPQIGTGGNFNSIFGNNWAPDVSIYYERQFFRSENWGSLGVFGMGSVAYFTGAGAFAAPINFAGTGTLVSASQTQLRFFEVPVVGGLSYRMNLFKYLRPYLMGGPSAIGGSESRSDGQPAHYALSEGFWGAGGISILMDWVSRAQDWSRYDDYSIKHTYLSLEYSKLSTLQSSPIIYSVSGVYAGFTFEY